MLSVKTLISNVLFGALLIGLAGCNGQNRTVGIDTSQSTGPTAGSTPGPNTSMYTTTSQVMKAPTSGTAVTLTWDLVTQLTGASPLAGTPDPKIAISVEIQSTTDGTVLSTTNPCPIATSGACAYVFSNPTITGGSQAVQAGVIGIMINGVAVATATTYTTLNRYIPASPANRILASASMVYQPTTMAATDTLQITFGTLNNTTFAPPTFTELNATTGVFGMNCVSCHSSANAQNGVIISAAAYNALLENSDIVPFQPTESILYLQTTSGSMPENASPLTAAQETQIQAWINDGAPNN